MDAEEHHLCQSRMSSLKSLWAATHQGGIGSTERLGWFYKSQGPCLCFVDPGIIHLTYNTPYIKWCRPYQKNSTHT